MGKMPMPLAPPIKPRTMTGHLKVERLVPAAAGKLKTL
jgi:hypothetical protein